MSKQEVKEEAKESEVNPQVKGKIRRLRRDLARRRMMKEVATATAVIVNPTHFAVALRYQQDAAGTPVVVAKGKNYLALRIRQAQPSRMGCRWWRIRRWRKLSTNRWKWAGRSRRISISGRQPKYWPIFTV